MDSADDMHTTSLRLPEVLLEALDRAARATYRSRTAVIRELLDRGLVQDGWLTPRLSSFAELAQELRARAAAEHSAERRCAFIEAAELLESA